MASKSLLCTKVGFLEGLDHGNPTLISGLILNVQDWLGEGNDWRHDFGEWISPHISSAPHASLAAMDWTGFPCRPFCDIISVLEPADHGTNTLKPWAKIYLCSLNYGCQIFYSTKTKLGTRKVGSLLWLPDHVI